MKPKTKKLMQAFRKYGPMQVHKQFKQHTPFVRAARSVRANELKSERAAVGSKRVRRAYRHYLAGRTSQGNRAIGG